MRGAFVIGALLLVFIPGGRAADPGDLPRAEILGDWRGTSRCVNLAAAPACKDETVLYHVLPLADAPDKVLLKADKIVNGVPEPMFDLEFHHVAATKRWESEFQNARVHLRWSFGVKDRQLTGTLVQLPDLTLLRKVETTKL
jgi:hypothetical protein